ncbi:hypothetical protein [Tamlana crocina]|uniref:Uncharacterized protein n=1 Tax=Tamlana crocina TaxID=393006 RepID=A0ABX1D6E4_9FLAO|nr:hypothetical protein [Tamlana crocina]NJX13943.1 hypothetical protein [Tamlana crocina]
MVCLQNLNLKNRVTKGCSKWLNYFIRQTTTKQLSKQESTLTPRKKQPSKLSTKKLYKHLVHTYNPNRFVDSENYDIAVVIFQDIVKHKNNHKKLVEIQQLGIAKLGENVSKTKTS